MRTFQSKRTGSRAGGGLFHPGLARKFVTGLGLVFLLASVSEVSAQEQKMMVRMSEILVDTDHLDQYKAILKEEAEASVRLEPGVIAIFPMYQKENAGDVRILEIYANREAYEAHLKTPHFQHYKSATLHMVKSLKLLDMQAIDAKTMAGIFKKMTGDKTGEK